LADASVAASLLGRLTELWQSPRVNKGKIVEIDTRLRRVGRLERKSAHKKWRVPARRHWNPSKIGWPIRKIHSCSETHSH